MLTVEVNPKTLNSELNIGIDEQYPTRITIDNNELIIEVKGKMWVDVDWHSLGKFNKSQLIWILQQISK